MDPDFSITSNYVVTCGSNGYQVTYSITVTNTGTQSGSIDFVRETFDPDLTLAGINPTGINLSGSLNGTVIEWPSSSFSAGQSKIYSYTVTLPSNTTITSLGSTSLVQFDSGSNMNNTSSFNLSKNLSCTTGVLPNAAIFIKDNNMFFASSFIILGVALYLLATFKTKLNFNGLNQYLNEVSNKRKISNFEKGLQKKFKN